MIHNLEIPYHLYPRGAFSLGTSPGFIFLDSALSSLDNRYSFIAADPWQVMTCIEGVTFLKDKQLNGNPWELLKEELEKYSLPFNSEFPPFQAGVAGYFSYEMAHYLENFPYPEKSEKEFPDFILGFYDCVAAFDHYLKKAWIFSSGLPFNGKSQTIQAKERAFWLKEALLKETAEPSISCYPIASSLNCNFDQLTYEAQIEKILDYLREGDIYQVNLSRRFETFLSDEKVRPFDLFWKLRAINPAPFSAYMNFGRVHLVSASPERFIKVAHNQVETKPIKGTRPRAVKDELDQKLIKDLITSEKDRAENLMIVDLLRNDLSRVCLPHTIKTPKLLNLETFPSVHHLVSTVQGTLNSSYTPLEALKAVFPGGSVTGVPKIRALEIISELEPTCRGPYCGAMGYIGFNQTMDTSIIIRTLAIKDKKVVFQTGGGIVADSQPSKEHEETLVKAASLLELLDLDFEAKKV